MTTNAKNRSSLTIDFQLKSPSNEASCNNSTFQYWLNGRNFKANKLGMIDEFAILCDQ